MNGFVIENSGAYFSALQPSDYQQPEWKDMVDPQLDGLHSPELFSEQSWNSLSMKRFILGSSQTRQKTPQQQQSGHDIPLAPGQVDYLFDLPPMSHGRGGSPFSQHQSSTCSSGQSPQADPDFYLDGLQGPSTPQDLAIASPYITANQLEHWDGQYARPVMAGQPYTHGGGCVNPSALAPDSGVQLEGFNDANVDPNFEKYNFGSPDSPSYYETGSSDLHTSRHLSSSNLQQHGIRDEIHVKSHSPLPIQYHATNDIKDGSPRSTNASETYRPYDSLNATKQMARRKKNPRSADPSRRGLLKRRHTDNQQEQARSSFTSHAVPTQRLLSTFPNGMNKCDQCSASFKDETLLRKHKRTEHIRPFTCVFQYAGCRSAFAAKNEWKRHVASQHLSLFYWLCTHGNCAHSKGPSTHQRSTLLPAEGVIFNRKDLFTQHIRRMHSPDDKDPKAKGSSPQLDERLKEMQDAAYQRRCELPTYMQCPAQHCPTEFRGPSAWDERMEHVARHLEAAAIGEEPPVQFGGHHDNTLTCWAEAEGIEVVKRTATGWETCNPLKGEGGTRKASEGPVGEEQDAEGTVY